MTDPETEMLLKQYEQAMMNERTQRLDMAQAAHSASSFQSEADKDLMRYQLEVKEMQEQIEHLLRGDSTEEDAKGNVKWVIPKPEDQIFNHYGVQRIMSICSMYINKNTMLSNYDEHTINVKMLSLGHELRKLIYTSYTEMGLETERERKLYPIIVLSIVDMAHSTYLRALNGMENKGLQTRIMVTQNLNPNQQMQQFPSHRRRRSIGNLFGLLGGGG